MAFPMQAYILCGMKIVLTILWVAVIQNCVPAVQPVYACGRQFVMHQRLRIDLILKDR